ncbi:MAG: hypothetical protein HRT47_10700 [Candidatus Caenarcaniphilales bacterium]|nr:hypothetical protein [Candidatus Caenarcaniphilales bacterium]
MKGLFFLILLVITSQAVQAYYFATDIETKVIHFKDNDLVLEVIDHDDKKEKEVFPIGTKLVATICDYKPRRHFMRDEYLKLQFEKAILPDGKEQSIHQKLKLRPRVALNTHRTGSKFVGTLGLVFNLTLEPAIAIALPVARGGKAIIDSMFAVYNTPEKENKWKQGTKGFFTGLLFPLREIIFKGEELALHDESYIWIQDAKKHKEQVTGFIIKKKNIYLSRKKYYESKHKATPSLERDGIILL